MALIRIQQIKMGHHWLCLSWKLSEVMSIYIYIYIIIINICYIIYIITLINSHTPHRAYMHVMHVYTYSTGTIPIHIATASNARTTE